MRSCFALALLLGSLFEPIMAMESVMNSGLAECLAENAVTLIDLNSATNKPVDDINMNVKCAVQCILFQIGIVNDLGQLTTGELMGIFNFPVIWNYFFSPLDACQNMEGSSACETAFLTLMCLREKL